jgi:VanZ family protein
VRSSLDWSTTRDPLATAGHLRTLTRDLMPSTIPAGLDWGRPHDQHILVFADGAGKRWTRQRATCWDSPRARNSGRAAPMTLSITERMALAKPFIRTAAFLSLLAILVASLVPGPYRPHAGTLPGGLEHAFAYMVSAFLLCLTGYHHWLSRPRVILFLTTYGALLEVGQLWVPGRHGQPIDVVADFIGACVGVSIASLVRALRRTDPATSVSKIFS